MFLLTLAWRKLAGTRGMQLCLFAGILVSAALTGSIPIYVEAIMQRMLVKDLENLQLETGRYPGKHVSSAYLDYGKDERVRRRQVSEADAYMKRMAGSFGLPVIHQVRERATARYKFVPLDPERVDATKHRVGYIAAIEGMNRHVRLIDGRFPAARPVNGMYEALVTPRALTELNMVLGHAFAVSDGETDVPVRIMPVGVIEPKDPHGVFFRDPRLASYNSTFFIDFGLMEEDFTRGDVAPVRLSYWYLALDYARMDPASADSFRQTSEAVAAGMGRLVEQYYADAPALAVLTDYRDREARLRTVIGSLYAPVLLLLAIYQYMVAQMAVERQKSVIAVIRSRGGSRLQIVLLHLLEGMLLGLAALLAAPPLGLLLTQVLGASSGFLQFVDRVGLQAELGADAYRYAGLTVLASIALTLVPVAAASRTSIAVQKMNSARSGSMTFWHKAGLDVVFLGLALYGLRRFDARMRDAGRLGLDSNEWDVDPLLFAVPALFMLGAGLLLLRIHPLCVRLVHRAGRRWWPPALYASLLQVGRSGKQYLFLMLFLLLTLAAGLFGAASAQTIGRHAVDQIRYLNGADLALKLRWENDAPIRVPGAPPAPDDGGSAGEPAPSGPRRTQYSEPPFQPVAELPGIEHSAKVFIRPDTQATHGGKSGAVTLYGIDTDEFGRTAWFRDGLLDRHLNHYLNLLAGDPGAVLVSGSTARQLGAQPGDMIELSWPGVPPQPFTVYDIVDYFPGFHPKRAPAAGGEETAAEPMLVVGHLKRIQSRLALEPYEVWLKLRPGAERKPLYDAIAAQSIPVMELRDTIQEAADKRKEPYLLALNGVMTLGFVISVLVSLCGYLLFWLLSIRGRTLEFGVLRAMGLSVRQLLALLAAEQLLTSGAAIAVGGAVGLAANRLFVPFLQLSMDTAAQALPFEVTLDAALVVRLLLTMLGMIAVALAILTVMIARIRVHQAVKLGEQ